MEEEEDVRRRVSLKRAVRVGQDFSLSRWVARSLGEEVEALMAAAGVIISLRIVLWREGLWRM